MIVSSRGVRGLTTRWRSIIDSVIKLRRGRLPPSPQGRPHESASDGRVDQDVPRIVTMAVVLGAVDAVAITELLGEAVDPDMPVVAGAIGERIERNLGVNLAVARFRQGPARRPFRAGR